MTQDDAMTGTRQVQWNCISSRVTANATPMKAVLPRQMNLPKADRPHWYTANPFNHDLLYLAWGERRYGEAPMPCSRHHGWVYAVIEKGAPVFVTPKGRMKLEPGNAIIVGPDHAFGWQDTGRKTCRMVLWMWRTPSARLASSAKPDYFRKVFVKDPALNRLQSIHALCREEVRAADRSTPTALDGLYRLLDATFARGESDSEKSGRQPIRMDLAARWIESHLDSRQPAARLADYLDVSPSTLHRLFKQQFGCSPDQYVHQLKMDLAGQLLGQGQPVKAVAYKLGYRHPNTLSRAFKLHFGHSPEARIPILRSPQKPSPNKKASVLREA